MLIVGLTGGIGSGKSTVANFFAELGAPIIDTDLLAREVTEIDQPALKNIREHFGPTILNQDGSLNRAKLRDMVFANPDERKWLEKLLHPLIIASVEARLAQLNSPYAIVVIPLLFESDPMQFIDRILVVDTPEETQVQRTLARDNTSIHTIKAILQSQVTRQIRLNEAHDIIRNDGSLDHLQQQVEKLHQVYSQRSQAS